MHKRVIFADEKLAILRSSDPYRRWDSLDHKRVCVLCERTFSGRQVDVTRRRGGQCTLHCPTEHCASTPHEWVYPGNPLLSEKSWRDWQRVFEEPVTTANTVQPEAPHQRGYSASLGRVA